MLAVLDNPAGRDLSAPSEDADERRRLEIVPFAPWHLTWLTETTAQAWLGTSMDYAQSLKNGGPCFSAFAGMEVIACAGVIPQWEGRAQAWSMLSPQIDRYRFGIHRAVQRFLKGYPMRRIECTVDPRSEKAQTWAKRLGFTYEGTMRGYTPQGDAMDLYAMVRD